MLLKCRFLTRLMFHVKHSKIKKILGNVSCETTIGKNKDKKGILRSFLPVFS